jgi:hypothetical protein
MNLYLKYAEMTREEMDKALAELVQKTIQWNNLAARRKAETGSIPAHIRRELESLRRSKSIWADIYYLQHLKQKEG